MKYPFILLFLASSLWAGDSQRFPVKDTAVNGNIQDLYLNKENKLPAGIIDMYGGTSDPAGWLICDGRSLLRTSYPRLFTAIGTKFGSADSTHFNIPDMRGRFPRGADDPDGTGATFSAANRDPDKASRTTMATGGATGDNIGSIQSDAYKSHQHGIEYNAGIAYASGSYGNDVGRNGTSSGFTTNSAGGNETRPINAYVNYIIKY